MERTALVLTGGGARAAYQAGVMRAISQLLHFEGSPFKIISGVSAGAFNGIWMAAQKGTFDDVTRSMWDAWGTLEMHQIFRTNPTTLLNIAAHWLRDLSLGGKFKHNNINYLLDTSPLRKFVESHIDFRMIQNNIASGQLHGISVTTTHYDSSSSVIFYDGHPSITPWSRGWREARRATLELDHVLASMAIPIFFPPVVLKDGSYGDGGIKLSSPLAPAIHMGADRILVIGVHHQHCSKQQYSSPSHPISIGAITGALMNSLFFHSIDDDIERLTRINRTLSLFNSDQMAREPDQLRNIPILAIRPSQDLGRMATELLDRFPSTIRYLLRGLGTSAVESWDLMSYLAFEKEYALSLLNLGFKDALAQQEQILKFFEEPDEVAARKVRTLGLQPNPRL